MRFLYFLESIRNPVADRFFSAVTYLGSETLFLVIAIIVFWCVSKKKGYYLLTVGFLGTILNQFLKLVCRVPRPWVRDPKFTIVEAAREEAAGYSFPSGHTQSVTASFGCLARGSGRRWFKVLGIVLIALTAFSRMYLGVHTPADVGVSLAAGTLLVFVFYPVFQKIEEKPAYMYFLIGALTVCSLGFLLFVRLHVWPADIDEENLASGMKNASLLLGCSLAFLVAYPIERKYVRFDERVVWWAQILKTVPGLMAVFAIKSGLKPLLARFIADASLASAVRYFVIVLFAMCVWPLTFRWFSPKNDVL